MSEYCEFANVYDIFTRNVNYKRIAAFIDKKCREFGENINSVFDVACGTGSLDFELEQLGYNMLCSDLSEQMLNAAVNKKYENQSECIFVCQDMTKLEVQTKRDCVICVLDSINHLDGIEQVKAAFESVHNVLNDGGLFIFDMNTIYKHLDILADNAYNFEYEDGFCAWQNEYLGPENGGEKVGIFLDFFIPEEDDDTLYKRISEDFCEIAYSDKKISSLLEKCGFKILGKFDDYSEFEPELKTQRIVYAVKKVN